MFFVDLLLMDFHLSCCSFKDKEVQRDAKLVSYKIVDKGGKPYVEVNVKDEKKVRAPVQCHICY